MEYIETAKACAGIISALGMLLIAGIVAYIAFAQYKVSRERHRFELFDRRISIYGNLKAFILDIILIDNFTEGEEFNKIYRITDEAVFLFKDDIIQYIDTIKIKAIELRRKKIN